MLPETTQRSLLGEIQWQQALRFFVPGPARPKGSTRAFVVAGRARITSDTVGLKDWQQRVAIVARDAGARPLEQGPVRLELEFALQRPKSHWSARGGVTASASARQPTTKPDLDKLQRAVLDALTGIAYADDSQVTEILARKVYAGSDGPGVWIEITVQPHPPAKPAERK